MTRLVLPDDVPDEYVRTIVAELGWQPAGTAPATETMPQQELWESDGAIVCRLIDSHLLGVRYVEIETDLPAGALDRLRRLWEVPSVEQLVLAAWAAGSTDETATALRRLAVAASEGPHPGVLAVFRQAFRNPDSRVRAAAVFATTYLGWPELDPDLAEIATNDEDPAIRDLAARTREAVERRYR